MQPWSSNYEVAFEYVAVMEKTVDHGGDWNSEVPE